MYFTCFVDARCSYFREIVGNSTSMKQLLLMIVISWTTVVEQISLRTVIKEDIATDYQQTTNYVYIWFLKQCWLCINILAKLAKNMQNFTISHNQNGKIR